MLQPVVYWYFAILLALSLLVSLCVPSKTLDRTWPILRKGLVTVCGLTVLTLLAIPLYVLLVQEVWQRIDLGPLYVWLGLAAFTLLALSILILLMLTIKYAIVLHRQAGRTPPVD